MKLGIALSVFALVWCVVVLFKIAALSRNEPYRFAQWDGGLLMKGVELGPRGKLGFALFAVVVGAIAAWQLVRWSQL